MKPALQERGRLFSLRERVGGSTGPAPFIQTTCSPTIPCDVQYPYSCVYANGETRFSRLLGGAYEYWVDLAAGAGAGEVVVTLRDQGGRVVGAWENPAGDPMYKRGWHVFDVDGRSGAVAAVDRRIGGELPGAAYDPNTDVCPQV